jgi:hypothetical protein
VVDERQAKTAMFGLNQTGRRTWEWEEAWIVHALVRKDGMTQVEVAELLGHHKTWVCRRLALVEKLADEARDELRLGLLTATTAGSPMRMSFVAAESTAGFQWLDRRETWSTECSLQVTPEKPVPSAPPSARPKPASVKCG